MQNVYGLYVKLMKLHVRLLIFQALYVYHIRTLYLIHSNHCYCHSISETKRNHLNNICLNVRSD